MSPGKRRRWVEWTLLYLAAPGCLSLLTRSHRWIVLTAIVAGSLLALALLRSRPGDGPREGSRRELLPLLLRAGVALLLLCLLLWLGGRWTSFALPRERPRVWLVVLLLYPLLSALPQELLYRALFFRRYGDLFPTPALAMAACALAFGWAHLMVHSAAAMLLACGAGLLLSITWQRSRSLLLVTLEHTLYGAFVFSAGIGGMFVNGVRIVSSLLG